MNEQVVLKKTQDKKNENNLDWKVSIKPFYILLYFNF